MLSPTPISIVSSPPITFPPSAHTCTAFMDIISKTKITCKEKTNEEEMMIFQKWTIKIVKFLQVTEFPLPVFKLDC